MRVFESKNDYIWINIFPINGRLSEYCGSWFHVLIFPTLRFSSAGRVVACVARWWTAKLRVGLLSKNQICKPPPLTVPLAQKVEKTLLDLNCSLPSSIFEWKKVTVRPNNLSKQACIPGRVCTRQATRDYANYVTVLVHLLFVTSRYRPQSRQRAICRNLSPFRMFWLARQCKYLISAWV